MKKTLAIVLSLLMIISTAFVVSASAEKYNYKLTTEFYADDGSGNYVPAESVPAGSNVKLRVSIETNFVSGSATMLFAYDKTVLSADSLSSSASSEMTLNEDFDFADKKIQTVIGANGQKAAGNQVVEGNLTPEHLEKYGFLIFSTRTNGCVIYDGSDWIFELDMKVLEGSKGKKLECFVIPETVCTIENNRGIVSFPYAPSESSPASELVSAFNWYEYTPELESVEVTVTPSLNERSITWFVDGVAEKIDYYLIGDEITTEWAPEKEGYTFIGWTPAVPDTMPDENLELVAEFELITYEITFDANEGTFDNGEKTYNVTAPYGSVIEADKVPEKEGYVFAGWSESVGGDVAENLGKADGEKTFYAVWLPADGIFYTVETYTMGTDGKYAVSETVHSGTTDETVTAEYNIAEGFALNEEKSELSGIVAADGSLVLKVYIDRKTYKFTTDVDGVKTTTEYLYGEKVEKPATPVKSGFEFTGWSAQLPDTMPANDVTVDANFRCTASVSIKNNPGTKTIKYGEKLRLTAVTANLPEGAKLYWYVDGAKKGEGTTFEVSPTSGTVEVSVKIVDINGNPYAEAQASDSQRVSVNSGFFQKIISFFKNLFGMNRTIIQYFSKIW
ncbi:MAG: InlB B-repeat-containing protein [Acutalibacteraceae bacterium]|nr:InlB B-repeat-containing protein [Acutalibacteraceae bacterium]